jgi:hypothetical protein
MSLSAHHRQREASTVPLENALNLHATLCDGDICNWVGPVAVLEAHFSQAINPPGLIAPGPHILTARRGDMESIWALLTPTPASGLG